MVKDKNPYYYSNTIRQAIFDELLEGMRTVRELSQALRISEKEVITHLTHVKQSALNKGYRFIMKPSECLNCGFIFDKRDKPKKPGRCPRCKQERPVYSFSYLRGGEKKSSVIHLFSEIASIEIRLRASYLRSRPESILSLVTKLKSI